MNQIYRDCFNIASSLALENTTVYPITKKPVYVKNWIDVGGKIYGQGVDVNGKTAFLQIIIKPNVFVVTRKKHLLERMLKFSPQISMEVIGNIRSNDFTIFDNISGDEPTTLVKLIFDTTNEALKFYKKIRYDCHSFKYIDCLSYWDVHKMVLFHQYKIGEKQLPKIVNCWLDYNMNYYKYQTPIIRHVFFDIETIADTTSRVPNGADINDILFSAVFCCPEDKYIKIVSINPLSDKEPTYEPEPYQDFKIEIIYFRSEKQMILDILSYLNKLPLHYLIGYNSGNYDIKYILQRATFYNISLQTVWYSKIFMLNRNQIHCDFFRIIKMFYQYPSYKLDYVANTILGTAKVDVSAIEIRYLYWYMKDYQQIPTERTFYKSKTLQGYAPPFEKTMKYNTVDVTLLNDINNKSHLISMAEKFAEDNLFGFLNMNSMQQQYRTMHFCIAAALAKEIFWVKLHGYKYRTQQGPYEIEIDPNACIYDRDDKSFPGGLNYCAGNLSVENVSDYDCVTAYPTIIDRLNLSDETVIVLPADYVLFNIERFNKNFKAFDYKTHRCNTNTHTKILVNKLINDLETDAGTEFEINEDELKRRGKNPIILIAQHYDGCLRLIVRKCNAARALSKTNRNKIDGILESLEELINNINENNDDYMDDNDDDEEEEDDDIDENDERFDFLQGTEVLKFVKVDSRNALKLKPETKIIDLERIKQQLKIKSDLYSSEYSMFKVSISSIYGCLGLLAPFLAASITCLTRIQLINVSRWFQSKGMKILYIDTDGVMVQDRGIDYSAELNEIFPYTTIECHRTEKVIFCKTKVKIVFNGDNWVWTQNRNGPQLWKDFVHYLFNNTYCNLLELRCVLDKFFASLPKRFEESPSLFQQTIYLKDDYKTRNPRKVFKDYLEAIDPELAKSSKHSVYCYYGESMKTLIYRPSTEQLKFEELNLFKFFTPSFSIARYAAQYILSKNTTMFIPLTIDVFISLVLDSLYKRSLENVRLGQNYSNNQEIIESYLAEYSNENGCDFE